jgi:hypothetical protein
MDQFVRLFLDPVPPAVSVVAVVGFIVFFAFRSMRSFALENELPVPGWPIARKVRLEATQALVFRPLPERLIRTSRKRPPP